MNRITSIGLLMILLFGIQMDINAQGNKKKGNTKRSLPEQCFTLDELQQLMTMPFFMIPREKVRVFLTYLQIEAMSWEWCCSR